MSSSNEGIWDDGEWVSWDSINEHLYRQELQEQYPAANLEVVEIFESLVFSAEQYKAITGRYLQIWGELGELFAEIKFGIVRHKAHTQGSDGRLGNDWVEIKTISPEKDKEKIAVKRAGNFNKLVIVRITENFDFEAKMIKRSELKKGKGVFASYSWKRSGK